MRFRSQQATNTPPRASKSTKCYVFQRLLAVFHLFLIGIIFSLYPFPTQFSALVSGLIQFSDSFLLQLIAIQHPRCYIRSEFKGGTSTLQLRPNTGVNHSSPLNVSSTKFPHFYSNFIIITIIMFMCICLVLLGQSDHQY